MTTKVGIGVLTVAAAAGSWFMSASALGGGRGSGPIIYVTSQGLFYDSIITAELPKEGPFQLLEIGGPSPDGLQTEFGPGDTGYLGGRWWIDVNGNGEMDDGEPYFACPLLGPGRETPDRRG